jgi:hypothetical protein
MESKSGKGLRIAAIVLMGMTAAMNVVGGSGTVCAAFIKRFSIVLGVYEYQWLYQIFLFTAIIIGLFGIWGTVKLVKGSEKAFTNAVIILVVGTLLSGAHYFASMSIRGAAAPANVKFYINVLTLIFFLVLMLPSIRDQVDFSAPGGKGDSAAAGGLTAFISGLIVLTVFIWAGPSHTYLGESWVEIYETEILVTGALLVFGGLASMIRGIVEISKQDVGDRITKLSEV